MAKLKQSIDAKVTSKYLYHGYLFNKIKKHFGITRTEMYEDVDTSSEILVFPKLKEEHGFYEQIYNVHVDKEKLNLSVFLNPKLFAKSTIIDTFLNGENLVPSQYVERYICTMHIGAMILVMYRADDIETQAAIQIDHPDEGRFVITTIEDFLTTRYPHQLSE